MELDPIQKAALTRLLEKNKSGEYKQISNPCPCGSFNDTVIADKDRHEIPIRVVLCESCGLLRSDPYYDTLTLQQYSKNEYRSLYRNTASRGAQDFFDRQMACGDDIYAYLESNYFHGKITNKKVYDIGCGAGGILKVFQDRGNSVYGCDYGVEDINYGKTKGLNDLLVGDLNDLRKYGKADIIINRVFQRLPNMDQNLANMRELLEDGGIMYIYLPGIFSIHKNFGDLASYLTNAYVWYFTLRSLTSNLERNGFRLVAGDESIQAIFSLKNKLKISDKQQSSKEILKYLRKMSYLKYYYKLKLFSIKHFLINKFIKVLRANKALYDYFRENYRKYIKNK